MFYQEVNAECHFVKDFERLTVGIKNSICFIWVCITIFVIFFSPLMLFIYSKGDKE